MYAKYLTISGFLFAIFYITQRLFGKISVSGEPFTEKHVKSIRTIGILIVAMIIITGIVDMIVTWLVSVESVDSVSDAPGIVFGVVIFCLSYIIDYGCALKKQLENK